MHETKRVSSCFIWFRNKNGFILFHPPCTTQNRFHLVPSLLRETHLTFCTFPSGSQTISGSECLRACFLRAAGAGCRCTTASVRTTVGASSASCGTANADERVRRGDFWRRSEDGGSLSRRGESLIREEHCELQREQQGLDLSCNRGRGGKWEGEEGGARAPLVLQQGRGGGSGRRKREEHGLDLSCNREGGGKWKEEEGGTRAWLVLEQGRRKWKGEEGGTGAGLVLEQGRRGKREEEEGGTRARLVLEQGRNRERGELSTGSSTDTSLYRWLFWGPFWGELRAHIPARARWSRHADMCTVRCPSAVRRASDSSTRSCACSCERSRATAAAHGSPASNALVSPASYTQNTSRFKVYFLNLNFKKLKKNYYKNKNK